MSPVPWLPGPGPPQEEVRKMSFATVWRSPWKPFRFKVLAPAYRASAGRPRVLDMGCGNDAPATTKLWWPRCEYSGLDRGFEGYSARDLSALDHAYVVDCGIQPLAVLPDASFDIIIVSHILEHLTNGLEVLQELSGKLAPGGHMYIEFPSVRSLGLPSMRGCLNFCDDATHVRVYGLREVANALLERGLRIVRAGVRRDLAPILSLPAWLAWQRLRGRPILGGYFWDLTGFASYLLARRRD